MKATYGHEKNIIDVTEIIEKLITQHINYITVSNDLVKIDPAPGIVKALTISYFKDGSEQFIKIPEGQKLSIDPYFLFKSTEISNKKNHKVQEQEYNKPAKKIADIIIPHHNRQDMLNRLLPLIDNTLFNIIVCSGGSYAHNCNKGAKIAETDNIILCNDDIIINNEQLIKIANTLNHYNFVGSTQIAGEKKIKYWGIGLFENPDKTIRHQISLDKKDGLLPSGFLFGIKKSLWEKSKGFNEKFRTGNEDVDFSLRLFNLGIDLKILDLEIEHNESQSSGRFKYCQENENVFYSIWENDLKSIRKKLYNL